MTAVPRWKLALPSLVILASACGGHGAYTQAFVDESQREMARMRAATQYDVASQRLHAGDLEAAKQAIEESIVLNHEVARSHMLHSRVLVELGRPKEALVAVECANALDAENADQIYHEAVILEYLGRMEEALETYGRAAQFEASTRSSIAQVEVLIDLQRREEAHVMLEALTEAHRNSATVLQARGHLALLEGDDEKAAEWFAGAVLLDPDDPSLQEDLLLCQIRLHRFAEAEFTLRRLLGHDGMSSRWDLRFLHACALLELGRPFAARRILEELVRGEAVNEYDVWSKLCDAALLLDDAVLLRQAARQLVLLDPSRPEGYLAHAWLLRARHDLNGALEVLVTGRAAIPEPNEAVEQLYAVVTAELASSTNPPGDD